MGSFLRLTSPDNNLVNVEMPGVIPAGACWGVWMTDDAREQKAIIVKRGDKEVIRIQHDGTILVNGKELDDG